MDRGLNRRAIALASVTIAMLVAHPAVAKCLMMCGPSKLHERLNAMIGQPVSSVFDRIGYPDRKETFGADTVYYWGTDQPDGPSCTYNVAAGPDGLVKKASVYGNDYGCAPIAKQLKP